MNPDKQRLYDAFMAGTDLRLEALDDHSRQLWRGRFEEWLDTHEQSDAADTWERQVEALAEADRRSRERYTAGVHE